MDKEILKIRNISRSFKHNNNKSTVINNLSLSVNEGEIICIFGRSGSGKTTLLNLTGGLDTPDSGDITINGTNLVTLPESKKAGFRRKHIGFVFQHFNLIPYLTAVENVELPLKYDGVPASERRKKAEDILKSLGLGERLHYNMSSLSGGQIQRVSFARAAVMKPALILADEPTGQLDSRTAEELAEIISSMNKVDNLTFILATHDPVIASISTRVIHMDSGKLSDNSVNVNLQRLSGHNSG
jgi:putative ABC transport system ATP-binding protein